MITTCLKSIATCFILSGKELSFLLFRDRIFNEVLKIFLLKVRCITRTASCNKALFNLLFYVRLGNQFLLSSWRGEEWDKWQRGR